MKNVKVVGLLLLIIVFPLVSADIIRDGYHGVSITNKIDNMQDFNDYVILSVPVGPMCHVSTVGSNGVIPSFYKFCSASIYVIKKNDFNLTINNTNYNGAIVEFNNMTSESISSYLKNNAIKLAEHIGGYYEISNSNPTNKITDNYHLEIGKVITGIDHSSSKNDGYNYFYIVLSSIALIVIILIIYFKKRK